MKLCDESCTARAIDPALIERIRNELAFAKTRKMLVARIDIADADALLAAIDPQDGSPNG